MDAASFDLLDDSNPEHRRFANAGFCTLRVGRRACFIVCLFFSISLSSVSIEPEPTKFIPVETIRGQSTESSLALFSTNAAPANIVAKNILNAGVTAVNMLGTSMSSASSTQINGGGKVTKFVHELHGIPILNDWVMMVYSKHNIVERMQYDLSQPTVSIDNIDSYWQLDSSAILSSLKTSIDFRVQASTFKRTLFKVNQTLIPAYSVSAHKLVGGAPVLFQLVISAIDASELAVYPLSFDMNPYSYRLYADSDPMLPYQNPHGNTSPHPTNVPGGTPPSSFATQDDFTITELSTQSDDPWLEDDATETVGNNVDVFFNFTRGIDGVFDFFGDGYGPQYRARGDAFDQDFRAPITSDELLFSYQPGDYLADYHQPFDSANNPTATQITAINAKQVQAFYLANLMRDIFYDAGFTEAAGNAQSSNFGRGGIENDPLIVHVNSFTFVSTPEDGVSPVIHLGRSRGGDTSFDTTVFAHEWAHYMFRRLVNPGTPVLDRQASALNEGWADVVGLFMSIKPADVLNNTSAGFTSSYAIGSYFTQDITSAVFPEPYFYGIRRYPYSKTNPFTFRHIAHKEQVPENFNYSDYNFRGTLNSQIHTAGEIWANTVWDCFQNILVARIGDGFSSKRELLASYIVGGLSFTPANPSYLEARNGLLAAIKSASLTDYAICRQSFSDKGMGSAALSPPKTSIAFKEVVESFANDDLHLTIVDSTLDDNLSALDDDGVLDQTESGQLILTLRNTGFEKIDQATLALEISSTDYQRLNPSQVSIENISPGQTIQVSLPLKLTHKRHFDLTIFSVTVALQGVNPSWARNYSLSVNHRTHFDIAQQSQEKPVGGEFAITMQDWRLDSLESQNNLESQWQEKMLESNTVLELQEPLLGFGPTVSVAWESPWMTRGVSNVKIKFRHAFQLPAMNALVEISENGTDWLPLSDTALSFSGDSPGFPMLIAEELVNTNVAQGQQFKIRFRTMGTSPMLWQLDDFEINGVVAQPFKDILEEDGIDITSFCFPIKASQGFAVVCL